MEILDNLQIVGLCLGAVLIMLLAGELYDDV